MPWRAPRCPACGARLWGRDVHDGFHCPHCRVPLRANATEASWAGWGAGLAVALGVVLLTQRLTGNWGATLAFSEIAVVVAYLSGLAAYSRMMKIERVIGGASARAAGSPDQAAGASGTTGAGGVKPPPDATPSA